MPDQEFPLQLLPDHLTPDQELPLQLLPDHLTPDHELPLQLLPDQLLPDQELPFHLTPDQLLPLASSAAMASESNGCPKMSYSPVNSTPSSVR